MIADYFTLFLVLLILFFFVVLLLFLFQLTKTARDYKFLTQHLNYLEEQRQKTEFALDFIHDFEALLLTVQIQADNGEIEEVKKNRHKSAYLYKK
ncbi:hypothetical protein MCOL2_19589 [Listeria fleischmannii FSL S10-1203]|uniref:Sensor histidine kinase n=1 Tax=Listeria fleischmannii FSL S10-1203 TaxID=1265822 RepID=W7CZ78_9LIST|nr:hypothetical protein MCOL2_19589 [Listeria fleischmannii FSL S10-1203]